MIQFNCSEFIFVVSKSEGFNQRGVVKKETWDREGGGQRGRGKGEGQRERGALQFRTEKKEIEWLEKAN